VLYACIIVAGIIAAGAGTSFGGGASDAEAVAVAFLAVAAFVVLFGYHVLFEVLGSGRTPGKRTLGLRVVDERGGPIRFRASAIRNLVRLADLQPIFSYGVGMTAIVLHPRSQRLGDVAAGTLVIRDRRSVTPTPLAALALVHAQTPYPPTGWGPFRHRPPAAPSAPAGVGPLWDLSAVSDAEADVVRQFLMRRWTLRHDARQHLATGLASRIAPRIPGLTPGAPPEWLLENLALALDARR
jgi:uncharacterized RDD family membrane protein YckC